MLDMGGPALGDWETAHIGPQPARRKPRRSATQPPTTAAAIRLAATRVTTIQIAMATTMANTA